MYFKHNHNNLMLHSTKIYQYDLYRTSFFIYLIFLLIYIYLKQRYEKGK